MKKLYLIILCAVLFTVCLFYQTKLIHNWDEAVRSIIINLRNPFLNTIVLSLTHAGDSMVLGTLCLLGVFSLFLLKKWVNGILLFASLIVSFGLNKVLKNLFERERPLDYRLLDEDGYSFPSGNAMIGSTFYLFAAYLLYKKFQKTWILWLGTILPVLLSMSRIYVGVHYPSDILAGISIGILCCLSLIWLSTKLLKINKKTEKNRNTAVKM